MPDGAIDPAALPLPLVVGVKLGATTAAPTVTGAASTRPPRPPEPAVQVPPVTLAAPSPLNDQPDGIPLIVTLLGASSLSRAATVTASATQAACAPRITSAAIGSGRSPNVTTALTTVSVCPASSIYVTDADVPWTLSSSSRPILFGEVTAVKGWPLSPVTPIPDSVIDASPLSQPALPRH